MAKEWLNWHNVLNESNEVYKKFSIIIKKDSAVKKEL